MPQANHAWQYTVRLSPMVSSYVLLLEWYMFVHITCTSPHFCQSSCLERWNSFHRQITQNGGNLYSMDQWSSPCTRHEVVHGSGGVPRLILNRGRTKLEWSASSIARFTTPHPPTLPGQTAHIPIEQEAGRNALTVWALWGKVLVPTGNQITIRPSSSE